MEKLKIGYFADGPWAHNAFELLNNDDNIEIKFICVRFDTQDKILENLAIENSIEYLKNQNVNSSEFIEQIKPFDCDLFVSMSFNQIFRTEIINLPKLKTINCHAGKLPFYRGRNILNWALINDEKEFGITVHYVDEGIDTGDIIVQETYQITDSDDYSTLLERAYVECANVLYKAIRLLIENKVEVIEQKTLHPVGMYCGMRKEGDEVLNWNQTSRGIFNFVRAITSPGPRATTTLNGKIIKIKSVRMIEDAVTYIGIVGQIIGKLDGMPIVKTADTSIIITEYESEDILKVGDRFQ